MKYHVGYYKIMKASQVIIAAFAMAALFSCSDSKSHEHSNVGSPDEILKRAEQFMRCKGYNIEEMPIIMLVDSDESRERYLSIMAAIIANQQGSKAFELVLLEYQSRKSRFDTLRRSCVAFIDIPANRVLYFYVNH